MLNFSVKIDNERGSIRNSSRRDENSVIGHRLSHCIAEKREFRVQFLSPMRQGRRLIGADSEHLRFHSFEVFDTSLVSCHFLRSTTGEGEREEGQHNEFFAFEFRERVGLAIGTP